MDNTSTGAAIPPVPARRPRSRSWRRGPATVVEVSITVSPGVRIGVDVADPTALLSVTATENAAVDTLDEVTGPGTGQAWVAWCGSGDDTDLRNLIVTASWVRRIVAEAIRAHRPTAIDAAVLCLDEALADIGIDNPAAAARTLAWCVDGLDPVVTAVEDGVLPEAVAVLVEDTLRRAAEPVAGDRTRRAVTELLTRLDERETITDGQLDTWLGELTKPAAATHLGETGREIRMASYAVDLAALPPRILRWNGARTPEILVEATGQFSPGGDIDARVYVTADDSDQAGDNLYVYAADVTGGTVLAITRLTPSADGLDPTDGQGLDAQLRFGYPKPTGPAQPRIEYGIFHTDTGPGRCRIDSIGVGLAAVDRLMIDAWTTHRDAVTAAALATRFGQEQTPDRVDILLSRARKLAQDAEHKLADLAERVEKAGDTDLADRLNARADAAEAYRARLTKQPATPAQGPITCEIVAATWKQAA